MRRTPSPSVRRVAGAPGVALGAWTLADCGGGDGGRTSQQGGRLTYAIDQDGGCIDPHQSPLATVQLVTRGVVDSLVAQDPRTGGFKPWLATSWTVSPDAREFTFDPRPGITFSDGTPLDAEAVKRNFDRVVDPATKSTSSVLYLAGYQGTTVVDGDTATVRFKQPGAQLLQAASTAFFGLESPATFAKGPQGTCQKIVDSGPFTLDSYTPRQEVTLTRWADHAWAPATAAHQNAPFLDGITFKTISEDAVRSTRPRPSRSTMSSTSSGPPPTSTA
ncbi:ABC transporter substrate-binding protein [Frankia sp. QA3]|uniref:ABC transporter substrate-binding protein n=1 Tax=Frankia sp. QA3 TaxID=710111 RepID=UPI000269BF53|nr:ABC transporter substrate-binding protein [Frankia sp. QA3]EIV92416.1 extracellular solute-binding protein, family 5 [Frankia sp. QA3]